MMQKPSSRPLHFYFFFFLWFSSFSLSNRKQKAEGRAERAASPLTGFQFGHFLDVDADALAVEQNEVDRLDGGRHGGHEVAGDGLEDQLGRRLLGETVPAGKSQHQNCWGHITNKMNINKTQTANKHKLINRLWVPTVRCRWRGRPQTWVSSRLPAPGSSSPSSPASPRISRSPSLDCCSGSRTWRADRIRRSEGLRGEPDTGSYICSETPKLFDSNCWFTVQTGDQDAKVKDYLRGTDVLNSDFASFCFSVWVWTVSKNRLNK